MTYDHAGAGGLDYLPCRYGRSRLMFRGPRRPLDGDYIAALGGSETFGRFVADPWPVRLERLLGRQVTNFGYTNAGLDVFVNDPTVIDACSAALVTVVQLTAPQNTSNRFYAVHPRRNDCFLRASSLMRTIFREFDFADVRLTRPMLATLQAQSPDKFAILAAEMQAAWVARMTLLLHRIEGQVVLLWLDTPPPPAAANPGPDLIDEGLVAQVASRAAALVRVRPSAAVAAGSDGMVFSASEALAARDLPNPAVHAEIAAALDPVIRDLLA